MDPNFNSLDGSPAAHQTLIGSPERHNTDSPLEGAAALDPYSYSNTPQPYRYDGTSPHHNTSSLFGGAGPHTSQIDATQVGFSENLRFESSLHEKMDDPCTWNLDTIREVATDMYNNPDMAIFDSQDHFVPVTPEVSPLPCEWNDDDDGDEDDEDQVLDQYESANLEHHPLPANLSDVSASPSPPGSRGSRKLKMHELPPQSDPEMERRRKRAMRQYNQRQKEQQEMLELQKALEEKRRVVERMTNEANQRRKKVEMLRQYVAQQGYFVGR